MRWLGLICLAGCGPLSVALPEAPPGADSVLVIAETEPPAAWANPVGAAGFTVQVPSGAPVWALFFPASLGELDLAPGPIDAPPPGAPGRALPAPGATFALEGGAWVPASRSEWSLRLPAADPRACALAERCFPDHEPVCRACTPSPPTPPALPALPVLPCPPGWEERTRQVAGSSVRSCAPRELECEAFALPLPGGCLPAPTCPSGPWSEGSAGAHVSPHARDGDGSRERPFGSIAQALATGARHLLLGADAFSLPHELPAEAVTLEGLCPQRTVLSVPPGLVALGALTLRRLRVDAPLRSEGALVAEGVWFEDLEARDLWGERLSVAQLRWTGTGTVTELVARERMEIHGDARVVEGRWRDATVTGALRAERLAAVELVARGGRIDLEGSAIQHSITLEGGARLEAKESAWLDLSAKGSEAILTDVVMSHLSCEDCTVRARRAVMDSGLDCYTRNGRSSARLDDAVVASAETIALAIAGDCRLTGARVSAWSSAKRALQINAFLPADLSDVTLDGGTAALVLSEGVTLTRVRASARAGLGVRVGDSSRAASLTLRDLSVDGVSSAGCGPTEQCWGAAVQLTNGRLLLERFRLARSTYGLVYNGGTLEASDGLVEQNGTALRLDGDLDPGGLLRRIQYRENERWCEGCR